MQQGIFQVFEHGGVNFNVCSRNLKTGEFPLAPCEVSNRAHKLPEQGTNRDQADPHYFALKVEVEALGFAVHVEKFAALFGAQFLDHLTQPALRNYNFSRQVQDAIELVNICAKSAMSAARKQVGVRRPGILARLSCGGYDSCRSGSYLCGNLFSEFLLRGRQFLSPCRGRRHHGAQLVHSFQEQ